MILATTPPERFRTYRHGTEVPAIFPVFSTVKETEIPFSSFVHGNIAARKRRVGFSLTERMQRLARHIAVCRNDGGPVIVAHRNLTGVARHGYRETAGRIRWFRRASLQRPCRPSDPDKTHTEGHSEAFSISSMQYALPAITTVTSRFAKAGKLLQSVLPVLPGCEPSRCPFPRRSPSNGCPFPSRLLRLHRTQLLRNREEEPPTTATITSLSCCKCQSLLLSRPRPPLKIRTSHCIGNFHALRCFLLHALQNRDALAFRHRRSIIAEHTVTVCRVIADHCYFFIFLCKRKHTSFHFSEAQQTPAPVQEIPPGCRLLPGKACFLPYKDVQTDPFQISASEL